MMKWNMGVSDFGRQIVHENYLKGSAQFAGFENKESKGMLTNLVPEDLS